jgi:AhpD family alkylhydroperoxidase
MTDSGFAAFGEELRMNAVEAQNEIFDSVRKKFGFVPNLIREMSESPAVARVYLDGQDAMASASLTPREQQAVQLAVSTHNRCEYCQAAHRLGGKMTGIAPEDIEAIQKGGLPRDGRLKTLVGATLLVLEKRGWLSEDDLKALEAAAVDRAQVYEVVAIVGLKTISNYVNHIAHTEIDSAFRG